MSVIAMSFSTTNACGPEFSGLLPFPVTWCACKYASYLDSRYSETMRKCGVASMTHDRNNITLVPAVRAWFKQSLHCKGQGVSV